METLARFAATLTQGSFSASSISPRPHIPKGSISTSAIRGAATTFFDLDDDVLDLLENINAIRPCMSNVRAEADSAAACARAPESRSCRVVPGVFGLAGASVSAPAGGIGVDQGRPSPCVFSAGLTQHVGVRRDGEA